ncbi:helix-turn-helix domain-containing protein [Lutimonas halocynthiae]|uniref:helix-turn-helix domain-containing protein n=1 Tax=Lutimonas halocynthiae TaxID=1446477 RepID=UPI0025B51D52|nr:helix-turn-helix domain-containing protein [Lutimonas halocynthiae]MDN3641296.1 helix-turn-helix domain-containing protein [Lutimonas halocynthiae]
MKDNSIQRLQFSSHHYDEFSDMFTVAQVEEKILESGAFYGKVAIVKTPNVMLNSFEINRKVLQLGTGVPGFITFTIWDPKTAFTWKRHEMKKGMIGVIWNNEHQSVTGSGFNGIPVSVEENFFTSLCQIKGHSELIDKLKKEELLHVDESKLEELRQLVLFAIQVTDLSEKVAIELIENKLVSLLIDCLVCTLPEKPYDDLTFSRFSQVIDYIHSDITNVTSLHQICERTNIPERTIRRLIRKKYDMSPKKYLTALRLNEVRKMLKMDKEKSTLIKISSEYNFWHMGQFSRDYKKLFGELPSETLRKPHS